MQVKEGGGLIGNALLVALIAGIMMSALVSVLLLSAVLYFVITDGMLIWFAVACMAIPVVGLIIDTIFRVSR